MKTYKNLYPKLCSYKNLEKAFRKAKKGKSSKWYVQEFEKDLARNLLMLKKELELFTYQPLPLKRFVIRDPKTRVIRKSSFRDRIIHHAIVNILNPIFDKTFIDGSYANRVNKGTSAALKKFNIFKRKVSKNGKCTRNAFNGNMVIGYILKGDIKHFFDSVNHEILIEALRRKIKDEKVLWLAKLIIKNFDDQEKGMPLGNMTSQFFANVYLNDFDHFVKHKLGMKYYLRYVDDFVILHDKESDLKICHEKIKKYLKNKKLEIHPHKTKIFPLCHGVDFLGFKVFYHYQLLRKRNVRRIRKRLQEMKDQYDSGTITIQKVEQRIQGWMAYAKEGNTYKLRKNLIKKVNKMFADENPSNNRAIWYKQKKE